MYNYARKQFVLEDDTHEAIPIQCQVNFKIHERAEVRSEPFFRGFQ